MMLALIKLMPMLLAATKQPPTCTPAGGKFFGIPPWWEYLHSQIDDLGQCSPVFHFPKDILAVGLAIIDILLRIGGLAAVLSIMVAGVSYITSTGDTAKITSARKRIQNSLIGLAIVFVASAFVSFIGNSLT